MKSAGCTGETIASREADDERMNTKKPVLRTPPTGSRTRIRIVTTLFRHDAVHGKRQSVIRYACRTGSRTAQTPAHKGPLGTGLCRSR